jgi:hypothetical protein
MSNHENLVIYPMPSLVATLLGRERAKGSPLTEAEVLQIRDQCPSVAVPIDVARKIDAERGYRDIDPERIWEQWQSARKHLAADENSKA